MTDRCPRDCSCRGRIPEASRLHPPSTGRKMLDDAIFVAVVLVVVFIIPALFSGL